MKTSYWVTRKKIEDWRLKRVKFVVKHRLSSSAASKNPNPVMAWPLIKKKKKIVVSLQMEINGYLDFGYHLVWAWYKLLVFFE